MPTHRSWLLLAALLFPTLAGASHPVIQGTLHQDTVWSSEEVRVIGDLTVPEGVTLTIRPGVKVILAADDGMAAGEDRDRVELVVQGRMRVGARDAAPVAFEPEEAWHGVVVGRTGEAIFHGAEIRGAARALTVRGGIAKVWGSALEGGGLGVYLAWGTLELHRSSILHNEEGGLQVVEGSANVSYTLFAFNRSTDAIWVTGASDRTGGGRATFDHITVADNAAGIYVAGRGAARLHNSIVSGNGNWNIRSYSRRDAITGSNNDIWGDGIDAPRVGHFSSNPLFVDEEDFRLQEHSPCRRAGSDGSDLGAFPYEG